MLPGSEMPKCTHGLCCPNRGGRPFTIRRSPRLARSHHSLPAVAQGQGFARVRAWLGGNPSPFPCRHLGSTPPSSPSPRLALPPGCAEAPLEDLTPTSGVPTHKPLPAEPRGLWEQQGRGEGDSTVTPGGSLGQASAGHAMWVRQRRGVGGEEPCTSSREPGLCVSSLSRPELLAAAAVRMQHSGFASRVLTQTAAKRLFLSVRLCDQPLSQTARPLPGPAGEGGKNLHFLIKKNPNLLICNVVLQGGVVVFFGDLSSKEYPWPCQTMTRAPDTPAARPDPQQSEGFLRPSVTPRFTIPSPPQHKAAAIITPQNNVTGRAKKTRSKPALTKTRNICVLC